MEKPQFSPEQESTEPTRVHDLLHLSDQEMAKLQEHLAKFDGTLRIFVHPAYRIYRDTEGRTDRQREVDRDISLEALKFLAKALRTEKEKCPPILVMDEDVMDYNEGAKKFYAELLTESNNEVYTARTAENSSAPMFDDLPEGVEESGYVDENFLKLWNQFVNILSNAGVKKVIIAGSDFTIRPLEEIEITPEDLTAYEPFLQQRGEAGGKRLDYVPAYCAGSAAAMLANRFQVELSNYAMPHGRHDQTRFEHDREDWDSYRKATEETDIGTSKS